MRIRSRSTRIPLRIARLAPRASLLAVLALPGGAPLLHAADPVPAADIAPPLPGEITRTVVNHGDHRSVLIEMLPEAVASRSAAPAPAAPAPVPAAAPAVAEAEDSRPDHLLFLGISVWPGASPCSVIQGDGSGRAPWRVVSNIDFRLLAQITSFSTPSAHYTWFAGLGEGDLGDPGLPASLALAASLPPASFRVEPGSPSPGPEALDALAYLHAHYATNRAGLLADFERREAERERRERELRENPPPKPDLVVRYTTPVARPAVATTEDSAR